MKIPGFVSCLLLLGLATSAFPADGRLSVESGIPLEISDADAIAHHAWELHVFGRYEDTATNQDFWSLVSRVEYGLARHWEISVELPLESGNPAIDDGIGDLEIGALYQFLSGSDDRPSAAVFGALALPTAQGSQGWDPTIGLLATQELGIGQLDHRVHLNFSFHHNAKAGDQRDNSLKLVIGYDLQINANTLLLVDFVREQESDREITSSMIETGFRADLDPQTTVGAGLGVGLDDESPGFRVTLAVQRAF